MSMIFWRAPSQPVPSICTARMAAFLAPLMATVATGTPEQVAAVPASYTGQYLKKMLER